MRKVCRYCQHSKPYPSYLQLKSDVVRCNYGPVSVDKGLEETCSHFTGMIKPVNKEGN